jgi:hypothetical protein
MRNHTYHLLAQVLGNEIDHPEVIAEEAEEEGTKDGSPPECRIGATEPKEATLEVEMVMGPEDHHRPSSKAGNPVEGMMDLDLGPDQGHEVQGGTENDRLHLDVARPPR